MRSPCDLGAEEAQPESGRHRRMSPTRQGPRKAPTPAGRPEPGGPTRAEGSLSGRGEPGQAPLHRRREKKRALWEREPDPPRRIAWVGCGAEKLEGDTPRRAGAQPNSCVPLEGNPRRCTELFVLGLRLTLASHGDLDVGDRCACYTPTPQRGDGSSGTGSRRDVDLGDILRSRTGRWMEDR